MSLFTWKHKYYPETATTSAKSDDDDNTLLERSIIKWTGLREPNLKAHDVGVTDKSPFRHVYSLELSGTGEDYLGISGKSCALCERHNDDDTGDDDCLTCPIVKTTGKQCFTEFEHFCRLADPEPMIELLKRVRAGDA